MPPSPFLPVIERSGAAKFYEPVFDDFTPDSIRAAEWEARSGRQESLHKLYQVMMQSWPELQCDVLSMAQQPSRCRWSVVAAAENGAEPTPRAKEAAETVTRAIWSPANLPTGDVRMNFSELLGSLFYGLCFGVSAYEIEWERAQDGLIVPARYLRLLPQYYGWSSRNDEPDSLLLYPRGVWGYDGVPFHRNKFIVALNRRGPSHPWQNGSFHALLNHFCAYKWGWGWLMTYCQKYGHPIRTFYASSDKEQQELQTQLAAKGDVSDVVVIRNGASSEPAVEMMTAGHAAGTIPHEALIERANAACHQLIRGQAMTNEIGRNGSRAQAQVGNDVRLEEVEHVCNYIADIINTQLIPAILELNYGTHHMMPMPELRFEVPGGRMSKEGLEFIGKAREVGLEVPIEFAYECTGIPRPKEGEEILAPLTGNAADRLFPDNVQAALALERRESWRSKEAARQRAENIAPRVRHNWLRPSAPASRG